MKKLLLLFIVLTFILLTVPVDIYAAEEQPISIEEIERLIEERLNQGTPLTEEELTRALLEMKDEKIENLEGNLSTLIGSATLFVTIVAIGLSIVGAIIGFIVNQSIKKKLDKIEEKENSVEEKSKNVDKYYKEIEGYHKEIKNFHYDIENLKQKITINDNLIAEEKASVKELRKYVGVIEDMTTSSVFMIRFLEEKDELLKLTQETRELLKTTPNEIGFTLNRLNKKLELNKNDRLKTEEHVKELLEDSFSRAIEEANNIQKQFNGFKSVLNEYKYRSSYNMEFYRNLKSYYSNWKIHSDYIRIINDIWCEHLKLNGTDK